MRGSAICSVAQAIALGPVPDGSMKPQLDAMAALTASSAGSAPVAAMSPPTTGITPDAVATFDANSVTMMTMPTSTAATMRGWTVERGRNTSPNQSARPEALIPAARASPPPNIMMTPHGARSASFQFKIGRPVPSGTMNRRRDTRIAIVPSSSIPLGRSAAR